MITKKFTPNRQPEFVIADFKAVVRHCISAGGDENSIYDSVTGEDVNTAEHGFRVFLDMYVAHWLENFQPWQILVPSDAGHVYRSTISPDYKANRKVDPNEPPKKGPEHEQEVEKLVKYMKVFLASIGATQMQVKGVEADDLIAYLVQKLSPKYVCHVYSVDADMLRLAAPNVVIWLKMKHIVNSYTYLHDATENTPKNMHGYLTALCDSQGSFREEIRSDVFRLLTLYKSIIGDSADGYSGVKGLGDAKFTALIENYGIDGALELEEIISNHDWVTLKDCAESAPQDKIINKLWECRNEWFDSWRMAELHPELCWRPSKTGLTKIEYYKRVPNIERVQQVMTLCNCIERYDELIEPLMPKLWLIDANNFDGTEIAEFAELCKDSPVVGWDYETAAEQLPSGAFNAVGSEPTGVSFCLGSNLQYAFYITVDHKDSANLPTETIGKFIMAIPDDTPTVAHNLQFETIVTASNYDIAIENGYDTAVMCSYVDENEEAGLKKCSLRELGYKQESYDEVLEKAGAMDMRGVTAEQVMSYGIDDSIVSAHLFMLFKLRMELEGSWDFYAQHEPIFTKRTALSQIRGVNISLDRLSDIHKDDLEIIDTSTTRLRELLNENCSKVNVEAVKAFVKADGDFLRTKVKTDFVQMLDGELLKKVESNSKWLESQLELDDTGGDLQSKLQQISGAAFENEDGTVQLGDRNHTIAVLCQCELYKFTDKCLSGSVYVPYTSEVIAAEVVPTVKNLNDVAVALELPEIASVAKARLTEWEMEVRQYDFDTEEDNFDKLTPDQQTFLTLMAEAKTHFKPADRGHEAFVKFSEFCCKVLGKEAKTVYSGTELNTGSPQQMQMLFYCMLGLPVRLRSTAQKGSKRQTLGFDGSPGTNALVVDTALAEDLDGVTGSEWKAEALMCIKRIKESETRVSLYHTPYPLLIHPKDGRLHPSIRSCGTVTRRPTCSAPNILQVSKHQKKGIMRSVYLPDKEGDVIVCIDFAGQELRILASVTKDPNLLSAYLGTSLASKYKYAVENGLEWNITTRDIATLDDVKDLHTLTGSSIVGKFGLDEDGKLVAGGSPKVKVSSMTYEVFSTALKDEGNEYHTLVSAVRKKPAKTTNFLMAYGGSAVALSQKLIIKEAVGQEIVDATMKLYAGIENEQAATLKFAKLNGYAETAYGNRRHATKDLFDSNKGVVSRLARQLFNARIQGCAADILKVVLSAAERTEGGPIWERLDSVMLAPVYDEVVASVPSGNVFQYITEMVEIMNLTPPNQAVPMMADVSLGPDWQKQIELGPFPTKEEVEEAVAKALSQQDFYIEEAIDVDFEELEEVTYD